MTSTSSVHPPILDPTLPGTPAKEWANDTTSALLPGSHSTATTPGNELPGAYPNAQEALAPITSSGPGVGETLVETARTYLPQGVLNTMDNYLGTNTTAPVKASENDIRHQPSLPSQEIFGASSGGKTSGVGALPGTNFESGVAKLEDERSAEAGEKSHTVPGYVAEAKETLGQIPPTVAGAIGVNTATVGGSVNRTNDAPGIAPGPSVNNNSGNSEISRTIPGEDTLVTQAREAVNQVKPVAFNISPIGSSSNNTSLPTHEFSGQQPGEKISGVGALPGSNDESGVAVLPHEKHTAIDESLNKAKGSLPDSGSRTAGVAGVATAIASDIKSKNTSKKENSDSITEPELKLEPRIHPLGGKGAGLHGVGFSPQAVDAFEQDAARSKELPARPNNASVYSEVNEKKEAPLPTSIPTSVPTSEHAPEVYPVPTTTNKTNGHDSSVNTNPPTSSKTSHGDEPGYHPAELHPPTNKNGHEHNDLKESITNSSHTRSESSTSAGGSPKKVGFMDKVSGGSKVLMGKIGRNEEKIDEGRRILHGENA